MENGSGCSCKCHMAGGLFIVLIGATFLAGTFDVISERLVSILWPIFLILAGLKKMFGGMCRCCKP